MWVAVVAALVSAFCFALAASLQQREALRVDISGVVNFRLLAKLARRPWWLAGIGCDILSFALHVTALSLATLAVVQPLGVMGIVFAVPLAARVQRQRVRGWDVAAAAAVAAGLIALLRSLPPSPDERAPSPGLVVTSTLGVLLVMAIAAVIANFRPGRLRAISLALGAGAAFGLSAVLVRALILLIGQTGATFSVAVVAGCLAAVGLTGYLLLQSAYRSDHFAASLATATVVDPVVAVLVGSLVLRESLPTTAAELVLVGAAAVLVIAGIGVLVQSPAASSLAPAPVSHPERAASAK